jgi:hypothetical protein
MDFQQSRAEIDSVFVGRLLLGRLWSALVGAHDKALEPLGLTWRQGAVLLHCARREANTPAELAFYKGPDISTMSRMLDRHGKMQARRVRFESIWRAFKDQPRNLPG